MTEYNGEAEKLTEQHEIIPEIKVYKKRWAILIMFMLFSISSQIQSSQYTVVANVIQEYYKVPYYAIDWTIMMGGLLFIMFNFPASYIFDKLGLRKTVIIGVVGTAIGTWIKFFSVHPDRFWVVFIGHGTVSLFTMCYIPVLPKVAATWFGYKQIATATGLGIVGVEAGVSLSFLLPPLIVVKSDVEKGLYTIILIFAIFSTIMVPIVIFFFSDEPKLSPSHAQQNYKQARESKSSNFFKECKAIFSNKDFLIFAFISGANSASISVVEILANQIILSYYPGKTLHVGIAGSLQMICSLLGSVVGSIIIDKFKQFKITAWIIYGSLCVTLVIFSTTIHIGLPMVYISLMLMGFFFGASEALHFEVVIEITYPQAQNVSVGLSSIIHRVLCIILTTLYGTIHRRIGNIWANITTISILICADLLFFAMKFNLRRTEGEKEGSKNKAKT